MDIKTQQKDIRDNIINLFEIEKLPEDKQEEAINKIGELIFQSVLLRVLPTMEEKDLEEYEKMLDNVVSPEILMSFFDEKVPNFFNIIIEESEKFKKDATEILNRPK